MVSTDRNHQINASFDAIAAAAKQAVEGLLSYEKAVERIDELLSDICEEICQS